MAALARVVALAAAACAVVPAVQKSALLELYAAAGGASWPAVVGWTVATDPCADRWTGVSCTTDSVTCVARVAIDGR
jgi:hypothetical protein